MKHIKAILAAAFLAFGANINAAIVHDTTVYGGSESIIVYDPVEWTEIARYDVNTWEVDVYVLDDGEGYAQITWHTTVGSVYAYWVVGANASYMTQTVGGSVWDDAYLALINILYPL